MSARFFRHRSSSVSRTSAKGYSSAMMVVMSCEKARRLPSWLEAHGFGLPSRSTAK